MLAIHDEQLAEHGGAPGLRDAGLLKSTLARPQTLQVQEAASDLPSFAAAYGYGLARNHPFGDGNKPGLFDRGGATSAEVAQIIHLLTKGGDREGLTKHNASKLIEALKGGDDAPKDQPKITVERWRKAIEAGVKAGDADSIAAQQAGSDSPADTEGLGAEPVDGVPF